MSKEIEEIIEKLQKNIAYCEINEEEKISLNIEEIQALIRYIQTNVIEKQEIIEAIEEAKKEYAESDINNRNYYMGKRDALEEMLYGKSIQQFTMYKMNDKTNIEEDIKILNIMINSSNNIMSDLREDEVKALRNILADRERLIKENENLKNADLTTLYLEGKIDAKKAIKEARAIISMIAY